MWVHLAMAAVCGCMLYSAFIAFTYVTFLQKGLTLAESAQIQKCVSALTKFLEHTEMARKDMAKWALIWLPLTTASTLFAGWLWYMLANGGEVGDFVTFFLSLLFGYLITMTFTKPFIKGWQREWDDQIVAAKRIFIHGALTERILIVQKILEDVVVGKVKLSPSEIQAYIDESHTLAIAARAVLGKPEPTSSNHDDPQRSE